MRSAVVLWPWRRVGAAPTSAAERMAVGVLCVAEKPSLAASIAKFLSNGAATERQG